MNITEKIFENIKKTKKILIQIPLMKTMKKLKELMILIITIKKDILELIIIFILVMI